jgi:hypothetical protein
LEVRIGPASRIRKIGLATDRRLSARLRKPPLWERSRAPLAVAQRAAPACCVLPALVPKMTRFQLSVPVL